MKSLIEHLDFNCLYNYISNTYDNMYITINDGIIKLYKHNYLLEESEFISFLENTYKVTNRDTNISFINDSSLIGIFLQIPDVATDINNIIFKNYKVNTYEEYQYLDGWKYTDEYKGEYSIEKNIIKLSNITHIHPSHLYTKNSELSDSIFHIDFIIREDGSTCFHLGYEFFGYEIEEIFFNISNRFDIKQNLLNYYKGQKKVRNRDSVIKETLK